MLNHEDAATFGADVVHGGINVDDPAALQWAAAVGVTVRMWRNSVWEDWHTEDWGLEDGEMMRANGATVKLVNQHFANPGTSWQSTAARLTAPSRRLPDGRTLLTYAGRRRLARLQQHARAQAATLEAVADAYGHQAALRLAAGIARMFARGWHGMPDWPRKVDAFCAVVADPAHSFWEDQPPLQLLSARPSDILRDHDLRRLLLAGPDTLSAEAAEWCLAAGLESVLDAEC